MYSNKQNTVNKKILLGLVSIIALGALIFVYQRVMAPTELPSFDVTQNQVVTNAEVGISFTYPGGEEGLSIIEPPVEENGMIEAYILMPTTDFRDLQNNTEAGEAPASISVFVFELDDTEGTTTVERPDRITRLQNWAIDNTTLTSFSTPKATPEIIEIDGLKAFHYQAEGVYQQDIYLATYRGLVYMLAGQYNEESDVTYRAFQELIASVSFN